MYVGAVRVFAYLMTMTKMTTKYTLEELKTKSAEDLLPDFKDVRGAWRTASLFEETCEDPAKYPPIYSLKDSDTSSCVSLRKLYLAIEDPTEYKFAEVCLGGWDHWLMICESWIVKPYIEHMRELLQEKLKYKYTRRIQDIAEEGEGPIALNAAKYLLELSNKGKHKDGATRGRPSKLEKERLLKEEARDSDTIKKDAERLGLKIVS